MGSVDEVVNRNSASIRRERSRSIDDFWFGLDVLEGFQDNTIRGKRQCMAIENEFASDTDERRTIDDNVFETNACEHIHDQISGGMIAVVKRDAVRSTASKPKLEGVDHQIGFVDWLAAHESGRHSSRFEIYATCSHVSFCVSFNRRAARGHCGSWSWCVRISVSADNLIFHMLLSRCGFTSLLNDGGEPERCVITPNNCGKLRIDGIAHFVKSKNT